MKAKEPVWIEYSDGSTEESRAMLKGLIERLKRPENWCLSGAKASEMTTRNYKKLW